MRLGEPHLMQGNGQAPATEDYSNNMLAQEPLDSDW